jgi:hypothetical protein
VEFGDYLSDRRFLSLLGENHVSETALLLLDAAEADPKLDEALHLVPEVTATALSRDHRFSVVPNEDASDYFYATASYVNLSGSTIRRLRQQLYQNPGTRSIRINVCHCSYNRSRMSVGFVPRKPVGLKRPMQAREKGEALARVEEISVALIDDFDGTKAAETVKFAIDGKAYEIDLSRSNASELRRTLQPYVDRARGARRTTNTRGGSTRRPAGGRRPEGYDRAEVRAWAKANRVKVSPRGRIANDVVERWRKATSNRPA